MIGGSCGPPIFYEVSIIEFGGVHLSKRETVEAKTEAILRPIADENGVRIYDVEYVKEGSDYYLRCYIDKDGGVTIDDCEVVSRALSDVLDKDDYVEDAYILEVSSPGLGRTLKKDRHLENSLGEEVELKTYKPKDGAKDFVGFLKSYDKDTITIAVPKSEESEDCDDLVFDRKEISIIRLTLDF